MQDVFALHQPNQQPKLLTRVRAAIRTRHMARSTEKNYIRWIYQFIVFHNKRINRDEIELRKRVKQAGGKWDAQNRVWHLPYQKARHLGLAERIVP